MNTNKFMAETSSFKSKGNGDELYSGTNKLIEVLDVKNGVVEIGFDHIRNERVYLKFDLHELVKATMLFGVEA